LKNKPIGIMLNIQTKNYQHKSELARSKEQATFLFDQLSVQR